MILQLIYCLENAIDANCERRFPAKQILIGNGPKELRSSIFGPYVRKRSRNRESVLIPDS